MTTNKLKIGIIGCGNMGSAIVSAVSTDEAVTVYDLDVNKVKALQKKHSVKSGTLQRTVEFSSIVILAVKPQQFDELLADIRPLDIQGKLFISIAAGIKTAYIEKRLGKGVRVVRAMPNLPVQVQQGVTAVAKGKFATDFDVQRAGSIFDLMGAAVIVEEKLMDAVTALSGSGPAYVFLFLECLIEAGKSIGLKPELASVLARQTLAGSLSLLNESGEDPAALRERVTSKGGTTQAALELFESRKIRLIFKDALKAAKNRAKELSK